MTDKIEGKLKRERRQAYVVLHSTTRTVWKRALFMRKEQALETVKIFYRTRETWYKNGEDSIKCKSLGTFTVITIKEFTTIGDIEYSAVTKLIKGEDHP